MILSQLMGSQTIRFGRANLLASLAGAALFIGSGAIQAQPTDETYTVTVTYADLDISTTAGVDALHRRIRSAAREVCGWQDRQRPIARAAWRICYQGAVSGALETLHESAPKAAKVERTT